MNLVTVSSMVGNLGDMTIDETQHLFLLECVDFS